MSLHIVQVGNVGPRSWASFTTENELLRSLTALGNTVTPVMENQACGREILRAMKTGPVDMILYTRTEGLRWKHEDALAVWAEAERRGIPTVGYHLDVFFGIRRRGALVTRDSALFGTSHCFTADGDHDEDFAAAGINHHWLPPAVVYEGCYLGEPREEFLGNVAFVGSSRGYHDEWPRRRQLVEALEGRYPDLVRGGDGVTVRDDDLNSLYASVNVVAGDSLAPLREASTYHSDRVPETLGRGGILVHPHTDTLADMYGDHLVTCGWDVADELAAIEDVLSWPEEMRAEHRREAVAFVRENHTYRNRCAQMLETVFG